MTMYHKIYRRHLSPPKTTANLVFYSDVSVDHKGSKTSVSSENVTFRLLKSRLIKLLICALESEVDSHNTQLLLGGIVLCGRYLKNIGY